MKVPLPAPLAAKISADAVKFAREEMGTYGWSNKAIQALQPMSNEGVVGIKTTVKYLMYQERGIQPFLMRWVEGRTIPLSCKLGDGPHFRTGGHVGEPGYVDIPHVGQVWRDQRWRHPGLQPKSFMRTGLQKAIAANKPMIQSYVNGLLHRGRGPQ